MASFHGKPHAPQATSALMCYVSLLFHLPLLLWLQGDSPGPVQKNLHNPIVQVGVPSLATQALPPPHLDRDFTLFLLSPQHPPCPYLDTQGREELSHYLGHTWVSAPARLSTRVCPSMSSSRSVDLLSASRIPGECLLLAAKG